MTISVVSNVAFSSVSCPNIGSLQEVITHNSSATIAADVNDVVMTD